MTREEIVSRVNGILIEEFELEPGLLKPEARLGEDLDLDSLDGVDLVVALEKSFDLRIKEEDARKMRVLKQIYSHICSAKGAPE